MNPYLVLGLAEFSSESDVKKAYRKLAQRYHPDRNKALDAEAKFKDAKAAYELIVSGKWLARKTIVEPAPHYYQPPNVTQCVTIRATFKDTFVGSVLQVPGTPFVVKPPYGCHPNYRAMTEVRGHDGIGQDIFDITWDIYDPSDFYFVEMSPTTRRPRLACKIKVSAAQLIAESEVSIPNLNPNMGALSFKLEAGVSSKIVLCAGLQIGKVRDSLAVYQELIFKPLDKERYDVLLDLKAKVDVALSDYIKDARTFS
jgi:hypothetical protein